MKCSGSGKRSFWMFTELVKPVVYNASLVRYTFLFALLIVDTSQGSNIYPEDDNSDKCNTIDNKTITLIIIIIIKILLFIISIVVIMIL